jgi:hypothetical protein
VTFAVQFFFDTVREPARLPTWMAGDAGVVTLWPVTKSEDPAAFTDFTRYWYAVLAVRPVLA